VSEGCLQGTTTAFYSSVCLAAAANGPSLRGNRFSPTRMHHKIRSVWLEQLRGFCQSQGVRSSVVLAARCAALWVPPVVGSRVYRLFHANTRPPPRSRVRQFGCVSAELFLPGPRTQMTPLFLAPRSMCRSTPSPPSATGLQHTHELATPMHACDFPSRDSLRSSGTPGATTQRAARTPRQLRANKQ
jgi:hypothetical protein